MDGRAGVVAPHGWRGGRGKPPLSQPTADSSPARGELFYAGLEKGPHLTVRSFLVETTELESVTPCV